MFIYLEGICRDAGLNSSINCILGRYSKQRVISNSKVYTPCIEMIICSEDLSTLCREHNNRFRQMVFQSCVNTKYMNRVLYAG